MAEINQLAQVNWLPKTSHLWMVETGISSRSLLSEPVSLFLSICVGRSHWVALPVELFCPFLLSPSSCLKWVYCQELWQPYCTSEANVEMEAMCSGWWNREEKEQGLCWYHRLPTSSGRLTSSCLRSLRYCYLGFLLYPVDCILTDTQPFNVGALQSSVVGPLFCLYWLHLNASTPSPFWTPDLYIQLSTDISTWAYLLDINNLTCPTCIIV